MINEPEEVSILRNIAGTCGDSEQVVSCADLRLLLTEYDSILTRLAVARSLLTEYRKLGEKH